MRVATFNTCHGSLGRDTSSDLDRLVAACAALDADVLGLQEVDRGVSRTGGVDQAAVIADRLGMACVYGPARRLPGGTMGNALLLRGSLADVELVALTGRVRLGRRDRRSALIARARVGDLSFSVAVTHLSTAVVDNISQERRVLDALSVRPGPHLLVGDLNRRTRWVRWATAPRGLQLVDDDVPTFPRRAPRIRIDHVVVSDLVASGPVVVDTGVSDHRALVVDLGRAGPTGTRRH
jgi:endonuclease/exonuclease/phosphatase family metal-dependent hydrolase